MNRLHRKSKMVSFRVSPDEFVRLRDACGAHGVDSISELARAAVYALIGAEPPARPVDRQLCDLEERVRLLTAELERLTRLIDRRPLPAPLAE